MRTTQYIGLTMDALNYVKDAFKVEVIPRMTCGMFGEDIPGSRYYIKSRYDNTWILTEEVQDSPWSSGPMIFTHLRVEIIRENGTRFELGNHLFSWIFDPTITCEYDIERGHYYV